MTEIEIRALIKNTQAIQKILLSNGFVEEPSFFQLDIMLDRPDASLFRSGQKIRIREEKNQVELTYKGEFFGDQSASRRQEINISIQKESVGKWIDIFEALGYPECFRIPKTRSVFRSGGLQVTIDNWPIIGFLVEIEGEESVCKDLARQIAPDVDFKNYRLKDLFSATEKKTGKTLQMLQTEYEGNNLHKLGRIDLLVG